MKRLLSTGFVVLMLLSLLLPCALAEDVNNAEPNAADINQDLVITNVTQDPGSHGLHIEFESVHENSDKKENYSVTLGGNKLDIVNLAKVEDGEGVVPQKPAQTTQQDTRTSWFFLTDIASIATNRGDEPLRATLKSLVSLVAYYDNGAMLTSANPRPAFLSNGQSLDGQIKAEYNQSATNLYSAIATTLDYISANESSLNANRCLVILSKGDGKHVTDAAVLQTVLQKIASMNVTVYTIAFTNSPSYNFTAMSQESHKNGHGGIAIDYNNTGNNIASNAFRMIQNAERAKLQGGSADVVRTKLIMDTSAPQEEGFSNIVQIAFKDNQLESTTEFSPEDQIIYPKKGFFTKLAKGLKAGDLVSVAIIAAAAVALVLIVVLVLLLLRGKKNKAVNFNQGETVTPPTAVASTAVVSTGVAGGTTISDTSAVTSMGEVTQVTRRMQLTLRENNGKSHRAMMSPSGVTAGRQGDNHIVLDSNDKHISRHHFVLKQQGEEVMLEGISETNGTYVNGMRISGPIALRQRDVVRVGGTELTVTWKYE